MSVRFLIPAIAALATLAACERMQTKRATYTCPNGPDLVVVYSEDEAALTFPTGRVEVLQVTDKPDIYAKPGMVWNVTEFRGGRLDEDGSSFRCDQMAG